MEVSAMSLNRVTIIGHLGQDPEVRQLPQSQQSVATFLQ
jgi:single-stranded DNA-binding protein